MKFRADAELCSAAALHRRKYRFASTADKPAGVYCPLKIGFKCRSKMFSVTFAATMSA